MPGSDSEQNLRGTGWLTPALLPVLERVLADAQNGGKLRLGQAQFASNLHDIILRVDPKHAGWLQLAPANPARFSDALGEFVKQFIFHKRPEQERHLEPRILIVLHQVQDRPGERWSFDEFHPEHLYAIGVYCQLRKHPAPTAS